MVAATLAAYEEKMPLFLSRRHRVYGGHGVGVRRYYVETRVCAANASHTATREIAIDPDAHVANYAQKCYSGVMENNEPSLKLRALKEIGKVLVNFGNLTFASLVLGTIIKGDYDRLTLLLVGGGIALIFITLGVISLIVAGGKK